METDAFADIENGDGGDYFTAMPVSREASPARFPVPSPIPSGATTPRADLFSIPENIRAIRLQIFEAREEVHYSHDTFEDYWRYCDNIWTPSGKSYTRKDGCVTRHYRCMLHAKRPRVREETKGERNKKSRVPVGCPAVAKKTVRANGAIIWGPAGKLGHNHDLTKIDSIRRSGFVRAAAKQEAMRGYAPSVTLRVMKGDNGRDMAVQNAMESIGGQYLTRQDITNAQSAYRRAHPNVRIVAQDFPSSRPVLEQAASSDQVEEAPSLPRHFPSAWNLEEAAMAAGLIQRRGERRDEFTRIFQEANNDEDVAIARLLFWDKDVTMNDIPPYEHRNVFTLATQARRGNLIPGVFKTPQKVYGFLRFYGTMQSALDRLETIIAEGDGKKS
ncbi:hypothetical protein F4861DRAFT_536730 [Xylaria intraflava]|nr:hypothetical protein F4861DRAFT_536730 [Xylaria intraflava]